MIIQMEGIIVSCGNTSICEKNKSAIKKITDSLLCFLYLQTMHNTVF